MFMNTATSPSFENQNHSEQLAEGRSLNTSSAFMSGPNDVNFQTPSSSTEPWKVDLVNDLDIFGLLDDPAGYSTSAPSTDLNAKSDDWSFLSAHMSGLPSMQPYGASTPDMFSSLEETATVASGLTPFWERHASQKDPDDRIIQILVSRSRTSPEPRSSMHDFAKITAIEDKRQRIVSEEYTSGLDTLQLLQIDRNEEHKALLKSVLSHDHNMGDIFLAGLRVLGGRDSSPGRPQLNKISALPGVHINNHLSLRHMNIFRAYLTNARALHFPVEKLVHNNSLSPFYRPEAKTTEALQRIMDTISDSLPRDLRPTFPQLVHEHAPFIDLLPFPTLRARAITFATCTPPVVDLVELKKDIVDGGLICWNACQKGSGQPWDMRSWEATPWFLRKWKILVGGEEDEVWGQTTWWRQLRGGQRIITS
jgi:hypothetical protein